MLCVIPVSMADKELMMPFLSAVIAQGESKNHNLLVVAAPSARLYATRIHAEIGKLFVESEVHIFDSDGPIGWPCGPNFYFCNAVEFIEKSGNKLPWLWCELDSTPLKTGWLDAIQLEYESAGTPYLGVKDLFNAKVGNFSITHKYMVGVGVYPPNFRQLTGDPKQLEAASTAFDVHYGSKIFENTAQSKFIQHCFRTKNYQKTNEGVFKGGHASSYKHKKMDNPVLPETVLLHGCDDGSLSKLVAPQLDPPTELETIPAFIAIPRCGTTYTRESLRLILRDRAARLGVSWAILEFGGENDPAIEFYTLETKPKPKQPIENLWYLKGKKVLFVCITSVSRRINEYNLIERISAFTQKPLKAFSFVRPPVDRLASVSAYRGQPEITENWMTKHLYSVFYGEEDIPTEAKYHALEGLIEAGQLTVFRFPHINEALCKIARTKLPKFFGEISHEENHFHRRPIGFVQLPEDIASLNSFDAALYEAAISEPPTPFAEPLGKLI